MLGRGSGDMDFASKLYLSGYGAPLLEASKKRSHPGYLASDRGWNGGAPHHSGSLKNPSEKPFKSWSSNSWPSNTQAMYYIQGSFPLKQLPYAGAAVPEPPPLSSKYFGKSQHHQPEYCPAPMVEHPQFQFNDSIATLGNEVSASMLMQGEFRDSLDFFDDPENDILDNLGKLLDEDDHDDYPVDQGPRPSPPLSWDWEGESVGQLAIKLAGLTTNDKPVEFKSREEFGLSVPNRVPLMTSLAKDNSAGRKPKMMTEKSCLSSSSNSKKNKTSFLPGEPGIKSKKGSENSVYVKKMFPKTSGWNGPPIQMNQTNFRQSKKIFPRPFVNRTAAPSKDFSSMTLSVNGSTGSYSDGSSSSNSSVHRESQSDFVGFVMGSKASNAGKDYFKSQLGKYRRRPRKAYIAGTKSSGRQGDYSECVFCKTNGETSAIYRDHVLKDERGRTVCKVLQKYICPLCGATGVNAHTVKYCPQNNNPPPVATMTTLKTMRTSTGKKRGGPWSGRFNNHVLPA